MNIKKTPDDRDALASNIQNLPKDYVIENKNDATLCYFDIIQSIPMKQVSSNKDTIFSFSSPSSLKDEREEAMRKSPFEIEKDYIPTKKKKKAKRMERKIKARSYYNP